MKPSKYRSSANGTAALYAKTRARRVNHLLELALRRTQRRRRPPRGPRSTSD